MAPVSAPFPPQSSLLCTGIGSRPPDTEQRQPEAEAGAVLREEQRLKGRGQGKLCPHHTGSRDSCRDHVTRYQENRVRGGRGGVPLYSPRIGQRTLQIKEMPNCLVNQCANKSGRKGQSAEIIIHNFPNDIAKIRLWLQATGQLFEDIDAVSRRLFQERKHRKHGICSVHFTQDCYEMQHKGRVLMKDAVPSIFPIVSEGVKIISEDLKKTLNRTRKRAFMATLSSSASVGEPSMDNQALDTVYVTKPGYNSIETQTEYRDFVDKPNCFDTTNIKQESSVEEYRDLVDKPNCLDTTNIKQESSLEEYGDFVDKLNCLDTTNVKQESSVGEYRDFVDKPNCLDTTNIKQESSVGEYRDFVDKPNCLDTTNIKQESSVGEYRDFVDKPNCLDTTNIKQESSLEEYGDFVDKPNCLDTTNIKQESSLEEYGDFVDKPNCLDTTNIKQESSLEEYGDFVDKPNCLDTTNIKLESSVEENDKSRMASLFKEEKEVTSTNDQPTTERDIVLERKILVLESCLDNLISKVTCQASQDCNSLVKTFKKTFEGSFCKITGRCSQGHTFTIM
ncbi:uncharacterized protein [Phyllobates terribilis]|uniref:uncharacterized protein isoform X2 n=1 Tax=Phyllobates terribilis TaxID=111132 RepID=UPI003CCA76B1